jgi:hypothetical protein
MSKPLTKALHTVRVVESIAHLLLADKRTIYRDGVVLFDAVLCTLGNNAPTDATLRDACIAKCNDAMAAQ